jgi:superfamily II DNA or RNA helicase
LSLSDSEIFNFIRKLSVTTLESLIGTTILKAIKKSFANSNIESELAKILLLKYGKKILSVREIRNSLIDTINITYIDRLCEKANITAEENYTKRNKLIDYYLQFNEQNSNAFVECLELDSTYAYKPTIDSRLSNEEVVVEYGESILLKTYLHPYQKRIKDEFLLNLIKQGGLSNRFIIQMPTGAGKTYTALEGVVDRLRSPGFDKFIVWIVDSNELAEQSFLAFKELWKTKGDRRLRIFRLFKDFEDDYSNYSNGGVVFTSFSKFHPAIVSQSSSVNYLVNNTSLLIVDEAHTSVATTYEECIRRFINNDVTNIVGLTATPGRSNEEETEELSKLYSRSKIGLRGDNLNEPLSSPLTYLQDEGYLATIKPVQLDTDFTFTDNDENRLLKSLAGSDDRNELILKQIQLADKKHESTIVFACTLDHVYALYILCKANNIDVNYIIGDIEQSERIGIIERFKKKEFYILINLDILSKGVDVPNINKLIITRPVSSPILYSQMIGRALRGVKNGGNKVNTIVNIKDNLTNYVNESFLYSWFDENWISIDT